MDTITLEEFMKLSAQVRRQQFDMLSAADQRTFIANAEFLELILGGYPSEDAISERAGPMISAQIILFPRRPHAK